MSDPVAVRILDREYLVGCTPEERDGLVSAATLLDSRMRELRSSNRKAGIDRIAVLAALNLAHELQQLRDEGERREREIAHAIGLLQGRLDALIDV